MKKLSLLMILALLFVFVSCDSNVFKHDGQKVTVLVVGLDYTERQGASGKLRFKDGVKDIPIDSLAATINDSKEFGAALDSVYSDKGIEHEVVFMLSEGKNPDYSSPYYPSANNVILTIKNLDLDRDDLFVFYYAGHGYYSGSEMYLVTGDTPATSNYCTNIPSKTLLSNISSLECRSVVILDSCYSGVADPGNSPSSESLMYSIKNLLEERVNVEDETKLSVLCASKWNEVSFENYYIKTENGVEEHGQFTGRLLPLLGWSFSGINTTVVNEGTSNEVVAYGKSVGVKGSLSLDEIYSKLFDGWTFPNINQHPVYYYTNETINLIPAN